MKCPLKKSYKMKIIHLICLRILLDFFHLISSSLFNAKTFLSHQKVTHTHTHYIQQIFFFAKLIFCTSEGISLV